MKSKWLITIVGTYLIAFATNLFPSLKYPDSMMNIFHLSITLLFFFGFMIFINKAPYSVKFYKGIKLFLLLGSLAGVIVFVSGMIEGALSNSFISDLITAIQYPFYFLFITPLFGFNYLFGLNYQLYSIIMSVVYLILFTFLIKVKKSSTQ